MSASFIGARVAVQVHSGQQIHGVITYVDAASGSLGLRLDHGQSIVIPRQDITDLRILPAEAPKEAQAGPSVATAPAVTATQSEVNVSKASSQYSQALSKNATVGGGSAKGSPRPARLRAKTPDFDSATADTSISKQSRKQKKKNAAAQNAASAAANEGESDIEQDFDFDKALRGFDKKKIWEEIKTSDQSDPSLLLVAHNRRAKEGGGQDGESRRAQAKLAWNEPVLSPSPPPAEERERGGKAKSPATEKRKDSKAPLAAFDDVKSELDQMRTSSLQRDVDSSKLRDQVKRLQARVAILEALAGADVEDTGTSADSEDRTWRVTVYESVASHAEARRSKSASSALNGSATPAYKGALTFDLRSETAAGKAPGALSKLRYLGADEKRTDPAVLARLPPQYKSQMGLKPESASIFLRRVKDALQGPPGAAA